MKDAPLHSYPWYVADWRGSETRLTLPSAAKYVYRELLDYCWIEGSMPTDEPALARIAAVEIKEFKSIWLMIKGKFTEADGRLTHWRVMEKRPKLQSWANSRVKGGETGGKTKAARLAKPVAIASRDLQVNPLPPLTLTPLSEVSPQVLGGGGSTVSRANDPPLPLPLPVRESPIDPTEMFQHAAKLACELLPAGGDVSLTTAAITAEFQKSANYAGEPGKFAASYSASVRKWRDAYDRNHDLRPKAAQWWTRDGVYSQAPPKARAKKEYGPQYLGDLGEDENVVR